jgi:hypothetical protein
MRPAIERWRLRCVDMPVGHWHCRHGHTKDCPHPMRCARVDNWYPATFVVEAGPTVWLYADEGAALRQAEILNHHGAEVRYRAGLTPTQLTSAMRNLPLKRRTVEDCRSVATRRAFFPLSVLR